jgi:uncharacterized damage-inducible protein DinB
MTTAELLLQDYDMEIAMTRKILAAVPEGNPDYKCHDRSMPLGKLTMHVATLPVFGKTILTTPYLDMKEPKTSWPNMTFTTRDAALVAFDANAAACRAALASLSDAQLAEPWKFSFGDHVISNSPRSLAYRHMCFNHLIHHRAQLGVYLRLNDIPVPGVYGPSADEPFNPGS